MNTKPRTLESGFTLVEMMVALVLGLILMAGVISVYITSKKTYGLTNALGAVQESGRFALNYLEKPIRMAGFMGCAHSVAPSIRINTTTGNLADYDLSKPVQGYEAYSSGTTTTGIGKGYTINSATPAAVNSAAGWAPNLPADIETAIGPYAIAGSDILVLHEAGNTQISLVPKYQDSAGLFISPSDTSKIAIGEIVIVSDCSKADLFEVTQDNSSSGRVDHSQGGAAPDNNISVWPKESYTSGAQILTFSTYVFFVGVGADGSPSLYEVALNAGATFSTPQELVSGVENMQILYGVDTDGNKIPDNFQTADTIDAANEWPGVVSVRIALLTQSDDNSTDITPSSAAQFILLGDSATDSTNGLTVTVPKDRRLRRAFTETIAIRNLLP